MAGRRVPPVTAARIVRRYLRGESVAGLAEEFGLARTTVHGCVLRSGNELRGHSESCGGLPSPQRAEAVRRYAAGERTADLARDYEVCPTTIIRYVHAAGGEVRRGPQHPRVSDAVLEEAARRYQCGATVDQVASEMGLTWRSVRKGLSLFGVAIRPHGRPPRDPEWQSEVERRHRGGETMKAIAESMGTGVHFVKKALVQAADRDAPDLREMLAMGAGDWTVTADDAAVLDGADGMRIELTVQSWLPPKTVVRVRQGGEDFRMAFHSLWAAIDVAVDMAGGDPLDGDTV